MSRSLESLNGQMIIIVSNRYIMVSVPIGRMREYEKEHGHFRNYQKGELESFFEENGFKTLKTYYAGFPFWSPITRDLLNLLPVDNTSDVQVEMGSAKKMVSLLCKLQAGRI